jgi:hypothetical protein
MRILQLSKDCLEVALFSNIDAFVTYSGYPNADMINSIKLLDENGCGYKLSVSNETLICERIEVSQETVMRLSDEVFKYLSIYGDPHSIVRSGELKVMFDEFEKQLGVTY